MAEVLFGKGTQEAKAWARRMLKRLKKPSGPSRVLHSAANHFNRRQKKIEEALQKEGGHLSDSLPLYSDANEVHALQ